MIINIELPFFEYLNECLDILEIWRSMLHSFNSINDDLKEVFQCISQNKLSFFEVLVVTCINDEFQSHMP